MLNRSVCCVDFHGNSVRMSTFVLAVILLLLLRSTNAAKSMAECPTGCHCDLPLSGSHLTVDCSQTAGIDVEKLSYQLDSLLSADHAVERLTSLNITKTPLTRIPTSICQLRNLASLFLCRNELTELPNNCFTKLANLTTLLLYSNSIGGLQDGLFDGLQKLVVLDLSHNRIAFIGLRVFSNASDITSLRSVSLKHNRLTSLEPWWYYRCILGTETSRVTVTLQNNLISNFTNNMQFNFRCGMKQPYGYLDLGYNQISHLTDIFNGWNIGGLAELICLANFRGSHPLMKYDFSGEMYDCDCVDYWIYKWVKAFQKAGILDDVRCNGANLISTVGQPMYAARVPLNEFVCKLTDRCPPSCRCVYRPANATFHIDCSASNFSSLPVDLPPLPKSYVKYKLDFSGNKLLRRLEHRPYFVNTSILDISNCSLSTVSLEVLQDISRMKLANFRKNLFHLFPSHVVAVNISAELLLGGNPWRCSCDNSWMIDWLHSMKDQISDPGDIICGLPRRVYGRNFMKSTQEDFCVDPVKRALTITLSAVASTAVFLAIAGLLFYKLRVKFYRRWKIHPFDRDECLGEDMDYDVFLCCSSVDDNPHGLRILKLMESNSYRVCYHERDFLPGELITDNMTQAVQRSKRTVCLISTNFLQSPYCMTEFDVAYHYNVVEKRKKRLIVLMMLDSPNELYANDASDKASLRQYLRQYTYIDYTADDWLDRLLYALPLRGLLQRNEDPSADEVQFLRDI